MLNQSEILNRLDFVDLLVQCGFDGVDPSRESYLGLCVFHHDTRTKSFSASLTKKLFHCFSSACPAGGGNGIHLYGLLHGLSYGEAVEKLSKELEGKIKNRSLEETIHSGRFISWTECTKIWTTFWELNPKLSEDAQVSAYMQNRGFDVEWLEKRGVKAIDADKSLNVLLEKFTLDQIKSSGLIHNFSNDQEVFPCFHFPGVLFPFFMGGENVVYLQTRALNPSATPKYKNPLYWKTPCLYGHNWSALWKGVPLVYIAEGPVDTLSLEVLGRSPAFGLVGTETFQDSWIADFVGRTKKVVLCFDHDPAGQEAINKIGMKFHEHGLEVSVWQTSSPVGDVNELLCYQMKNKKSLNASIPVLPTSIIR